MRNKTDCSRWTVALSMSLGLMAVGMLQIPSALAEDPFRIGGLMPMSNGPFVALGQDVWDGLGLAISEGGSQVGQRKIELLREDTTHKPDIALEKAKKLVFEEHADVLVGPLSASELTALVTFANQSKTILIPLSGDNSITGSRCSPWLVRTSFSDDQVSRNIAPWLLRNNYKKASVIASDYTAGHEAADAFKRTFTAGGGTIVSEQYTPLGPISDFGPYLAKIKGEKPDVVYAFIPGTPGIAFVKQYADFGLKGEIALGVGGWMVSPLSLPAEGDAANGVIGVLNYVPSIDNPANVAFRKSFEAKFNRTVSEYAAYGFDTGKLIYAALQKLNGNTQDKGAFVQALHDVKIQGTRGDLKIDPKTNNVIQDIYVFKVDRSEGKAGYTIVDHLHDVQDPENGCKL